MDSVEDTLAGGFPHSEICGSKPARGSPQLIAACYVLHRLSVPRHPPDALKALDHAHIRRDKPTACRRISIARPMKETILHGFDDQELLPIHDDKEQIALPEKEDLPVRSTELFP